MSWHAGQLEEKVSRFVTEKQLDVFNEGTQSFNFCEFESTGYRFNEGREYSYTCRCKISGDYLTRGRSI